MWSRPQAAAAQVRQTAQIRRISPLKCCSCSHPVLFKFLQLQGLTQMPFKLAGMGSKPSRAHTHLLVQCDPPPHVHPVSQAPHASRFKHPEALCRCSRATCSTGSSVTTNSVTTDYYSTTDGQAASKGERGVACSRGGGLTVLLLSLRTHCTAKLFV